MLNLNVQIGKNPLQKHKPIYYKQYEQYHIPYSYSIGEYGQIVAWKKSIHKDNTFANNKINEQNKNNGSLYEKQYKIQLINSQFDQDNLYVPVYYMIPSINGDHSKCLSFIITQLRLINQQQKTYKIVSYHSDNRLRIWEVRDGSCINISSHNLFNQKIIGLCQNNIPQTRFIFPFSQNSIYIFDCWTMSVIDKIQPKKQTYSQFLKGSINQNKQLQLYDNYHNSYKLNLSKLFKQTFIDVGRTINSIQKVHKELIQIVNQLHSQKLVLIHKTWKTDNYKIALQYINKSLQIYLSQQKCLTNIFNHKFLQKYPQLQKFIGDSDKVVVENLFFIKGTDLWYFVGTDQGKVFGFPVIKQKIDSYSIVNQYTHYNPINKNPVKYINLVDNLLVISWQNGQFKVYTTDNLHYMLEHQINQLNKQPQNKKSQQELKEKKNSLYEFDFNKLCISRQKFSSFIKYTVPIYLLSTNATVNSTKINSHDTAFQLQNNQIIIFDSLHHQISHFVGIQEKIKIYVVLYLGGSSQYIGIATQNGIQVFGSQGYQRIISYKQWDWKDWNIVAKYQCKNDFNTFKSSSNKGLQLIQFANRHTINQIQYTSSLNTLLQQTFGLIDVQGFTNQIYSKFYFTQKNQVQKTLHSRSIQNFIAVLKHKHNYFRRDNCLNTSFFINCSLNKQLDSYSSTNGNNNIQQTILNNYLFYSCFMWDMFEIPFLTPLMRRLPKQFALKRRYASQGIGKSLTIYFDQQECIFNLSKYLLTEYAISSISFMQCYVLKEIQKADQLVSVVEFFTLNNKKQNIYVSGQILSKSIISSNQNIVKACINLLISTIIAGHMNIHPLYQYFVLNLKNMQEDKQGAQSSIALQSNSASKASSNIHSSSKASSSISSIFPSSQKISIPNSKQLTQIQCQWILYLGLCLIYNKAQTSKHQIKMLLNRIIQCIQLSNFINKPDLIQVVLKLINQGLSQVWKQYLAKQIVIKLYLDLFRIFFFYDGIGNVSNDDKKFNFCFQNNSPQQIKKMKQSIIKTIVFLSKQFNNEFIQCLTTQTINQKPHHSYPASVIQILRQYLKSQKPTSYLVFYIELLLQCLSPMTPNLRKYVQKNVISTLQLMCTYKSVTFNQASQRLSIKSNNHLYIYCLRTSTKWRTISLLKQEGKQQIEGVRDQDCVLQMSPKGNYIALMTYKKIYIWRLTSGFWSGLLGSFSQRQSYDLPKGGRNINIVWDQNQTSITIVNEDPSLNKAYKV